MAKHQSVLLDAAIAGLAVRPGGHYIDATYGRGGHSAAILSRLRGSGALIALDRDPDACAHASQQWGREPLFRIRHRSFADLAAVVAEAGMEGRIDGILFDLGASSPQFDDPGRGFSFRQGGPLDMRMDPSAGEPASAWLARAASEEIARVLREYGEERFAGRIARAIVAARADTPITRTDQLAQLIAAAVPRSVADAGRIHPATRSFQALRIHVNGELAALEAALDACPAALAPGGRLVAISFHSLEDRRVKRFLRSQARPEPPPLPMAPAPEPRLRLVGGPQYPGADEIGANPRARSAVLRVAERTAAPL